MLNTGMNILLLGEYSNVHATLADGLRALGHRVVVASDGDGWKDYPRDVDLRRVSHGRLSTMLYMLRLWRRFRTFRGYDIVQIINPVFLPLRAERIRPFYQYLRRHNRCVVMGAFGMDHYYVRACLDCRTFRYSDFNFGQTVRHYDEAEAYRRDWLDGAKGLLNRQLAADCDAIVAGLYEYWAAYRNEPSLACKLTFIPFPIRLPAEPSRLEGGGTEPPSPVTFFIGIQRGKEVYKGTDVMLRALERVERELPDHCRLIQVTSLPFAEYKRRLSEADVLLDQLYSYTPAMNALEAMARGSVVVSGGEPEGYAMLEEEELRPIVNVLPDDEDVYRKLRHLALHPDEVSRRKRDGADYIRRHHDHLAVARRYETLYQNLLKGTRP